MAIDSAVPDLRCLRGDEFYQPPVELPGRHGALIWHRELATYAYLTPSQAM